MIIAKLVGLNSKFVDRIGNVMDVARKCSDKGKDSVSRRWVRMCCKFKFQRHLLLMIAELMLQLIRVVGALMALNGLHMST